MFIRRSIDNASASMHGKCGRCAQNALLQRQYFDSSDDITPQLERELIALKLLHDFIIGYRVEVTVVRELGAFASYFRHSHTFHGVK